MNSERTNNRNRFAIRLILLVLIAVTLFTLAVAVQPSQAQSNPTLVVDVNQFVDNLNIYSISILYPRAGSLSYVCPSELLCDRTGSQEWFKASHADTNFTIHTYGGAMVWDIEGYELHTDYNVTQNPDGTSFVTFVEEIQAGADLLIHIRSITAVAEYGVR